ncbi:hypothetical protein O4J55_25870, partial [Paracoccus sp. PXZ]
WNLQCAGRLLTEKPLDMDNLGRGGQAFLLRETGTASLEDLAARLAETVATAGAIIDDVLAGVAAQAE